jgi:SAM-dependent methyltransferase
MDERAAKGFVGARQYNTYRPSYPPETIAFLRGAAGLCESSTIVDLAAGTGLMTRLLSPAGRLIAVEPIAEMREVLAAEVPEAEVLSGFAEAIPLPPAVADAVVVAQAFHWFANPAAVNEIARVLRPDGALAIVWNIRDRSDPVMRELHTLLEPYRRNSPDFDNLPWREVFEAPSSPLELSDAMRLDWEEPITLERLKGRVLSLSYVALTDDDGRLRVMAALEGLAHSAADDTPVIMKHHTEVFIARRRPEI